MSANILKKNINFNYPTSKYWILKELSLKNNINIKDLFSNEANKLIKEVELNSTDEYFKEYLINSKEVYTKISIFLDKKLIEDLKKIAIKEKIKYNHLYQIIIDRIVIEP